MIAFIITSTSSSHVLFAKFWASMTDDSIATFQQRLFDETRDALAQIELGQEHVIESAPSQYALFLTTGHLTFYLCGSEQSDDEILVSETLRLLIDVLGDTLKRLTEESVISQYDKVVLVVDAIVQDGVVEVSDKADAIRSLTLS
eukprot:Amastigsp_a512679_16.p2 type:complete len:145 gc:universal Amastigsp_a512679_16:506-72(-)